jgi:hypothetical protein
VRRREGETRDVGRETITTTTTKGATHANA